MMPSLAEKIKALSAERATIDVDLMPIVGIEATIKVRPLNVAEDDEAFRAAATYRRSVITSLPDTHVKALLADPAFLEDAQSVERLFLAARDPEDVSKPAFPSAAFMRDNFTHSQLQTLYGYLEKAEQPSAEFADRAWVLMLAASVANSASDDALMQLPKPVLADLFIRLSEEYQKKAA